MQEIQSEEQQQPQITPELVKDLEELVIDPKQEVKKGVLSILMQYLQSESNREAFLDHPIFFKALLNYINHDELETASLTCLIQLASESSAHEQLHNIDAADRIVNNIKDVVNEIAKKEFQITRKDALIIELSSIFLINFTSSVLGKNSFLSMSRDESVQGINIMIMLKMFESPKTAYLVKHFSNVLVNISSYDTGRMLLVKPENQFLELCLPHIINQNTNLRTGIQKSVRNCLFEYEDQDFLNYLFSEKVNFINISCCAILKAILSSNLLNYKGMKNGERSEKIDYVIQQKLKKQDINPEIKYKDSKGEQAEMEELQILIDYILILSNVDRKANKLHYDVGLVTETIEILRNIKFSVEVNDKVDVLAEMFK